MSKGEWGDCPDWYDLVARVRRAAGYLGCSFFELLDRVERGEMHWLRWAERGRAAEVSAYGAPWPPAQVVGTIGLGLRKED